ncbi:hypothetical protein ACIRBZ_39150 [Streptomyces sp. NPDC094038]|uniref:hypothetical protein n=1 Tax=Streptomyces sp. NPDC094038 TaxID=3366055 RepID=UPI003816E622
MFTGLSAFPLTPIAADGSIDEEAFALLVRRLTTAGVDSIGALGRPDTGRWRRRCPRACSAGGER